MGNLGSVGAFCGDRCQHGRPDPQAEFREWVQVDTMPAAISEGTPWPAAEPVCRSRWPEDVSAGKGDESGVSAGVAEAASFVLYTEPRATEQGAGRACFSRQDVPGPHARSINPGAEPRGISQSQHDSSINDNVYGVQSHHDSISDHAYGVQSHHDSISDHAYGGAQSREDQYHPPAPDSRCSPHPRRIATAPKPSTFDTPRPRAFVPQEDLPFSGAARPPPPAPGAGQGPRELRNSQPHGLPGLYPSSSAPAEVFCADRYGAALVQEHGPSRRAGDDRFHSPHRPPITVVGKPVARPAAEYEAMAGDDIDVRVEYYARKLPAKFGQCLMISRVSQGEYEIGPDKVSLVWKSVKNPHSGWTPNGPVIDEIFVYGDRDRKKKSGATPDLNMKAGEPLPYYLQHSANVAYELSFGSPVSNVPKDYRLTFPEVRGVSLENGRDPDAKLNAMCQAKKQAEQREQAALEWKKSSGSPERRGRGGRTPDRRVPSEGSPNAQTPQPPWLFGSYPPQLAVPAAFQFDGHGQVAPY